MYAYVSKYRPLRNRVREAPDIRATLLGALEPGESMSIVGGPECADGFVWWQVSSQTQVMSGWTPEGDASGYWLVPMPAVSVRAGRRPEHVFPPNPRLESFWSRFGFACVLVCGCVRR